MGNAGSSGVDQPRLFCKRDESFGSKSPRRYAKHAVNHRPHQLAMTTTADQFRMTMMGPEEREMWLRGRGADSSNGFAATATPSSSRGLRQHQLIRHNRSQSLEQSGTHSPSSSRSSSSNSYVNSVLAGSTTAGNGGGASDRSCLRQSTEPMFNISGDLNPHQIGLVKRAWKAAMKATNNDEMELASSLLLRIFQLDPRNMAYFSLKDVPMNELRHHHVFTEHVKTFHPTLLHVMNHLTNATMLSKHLQQLGGRHVNYTGVTYKCPYWKSFIQSLVDVLSDQQGNNADCELQDALTVLGDFCVEQMRIGYRIEHKLQCEAERLAQAQQRRRRAFDLSSRYRELPF